MLIVGRIAQFRDYPYHHGPERSCSLRTHHFHVHFIQRWRLVLGMGTIAAGTAYVQSLLNLGLQS